jgi:Lon protease-like protein
MSAPLLPLFPLRAVVFPGTRLALHIFEERYKEMVGEAIREASEFGIILEREEGIFSTGCTVTVEKVLKLHEDGSMDILTAGRRRFEVVMLNEQKAYLRAEVQFFDDEDTSPPAAEARERAMANYRALLAAGGGEAGGPPDPAGVALSFQLAQAIPDPEFLALLLRTRSEAERLRVFNEYMARYLPRQQAIARAQRIAPTNGRAGASLG